MIGVTRDWQSIYSPLIGKRLDALCFLAHQGSDSPDVMKNLREPTIGFSGSVLLAFEGPTDLYLTWAATPGTTDYGLAAHHTEEEAWRRLALDRINMSPEEPWSHVAGASLRAVSICASDRFSAAGTTTTAKHSFEGPGGPVTLWVSTAYGEALGPGDDLLVSVLPDLIDQADLKTVETIQ